MKTLFSEFNVKILILIKNLEKEGKTIEEIKNAIALTYEDKAFEITQSVETSNKLSQEDIEFLNEFVYQRIKKEIEERLDEILEEEVGEEQLINNFFDENEGDFIPFLYRELYDAQEWRVYDYLNSAVEEEIEYQTKDKEENVKNKLSQIFNDLYEIRDEVDNLINQLPSTSELREKIELMSDRLGDADLEDEIFND